MNYEGLSKNEKYILTHDVITEYLTEILMQYTYNGEFHVKQYFDDVFIKNVDIWGFIMSYSVVLEAYYANYGKLNKGEHLVYDKLRNIFARHLFVSSLSVIDTDELLADLTALSTLWRSDSFPREEIKLSRESAFSISSIVEDAVAERKDSNKVISALMGTK